MGLDLSLTSTGIAVVKGSDFFSASSLRVKTKVRAKSWTIKTTPRMGSPEKRIDHVLRNIVKVIEKYSPEYVMIEAPAFRAQGSQPILGELAGVIKHHLFARKVPPFDLVPPSTLKKFGAGSGKASKEDMIEAAKKLHPRVKNDHEADAFFLALKAQEILGAEIP